MTTMALCVAVLLVILSTVAGNALQLANGIAGNAAQEDVIDPSISLADFGWTTPAGSSYFVPAAAAASSSGDPGPTWTTECKAGVAPDATHTADYQSQYGFWGSGITLWISFYYRVEGVTGENFRLTLSKVYSTSTPVALWEERVASTDWVKVRLAVLEDGEFAFRIAARHACSGSVFLSAISVVVEPPTTTTTTTTTTPTTTTTTKRNYPDPVVTFRLVDLSIPDIQPNGNKCDVAFTNHRRKCDPYLDLKYNWNGQTSSESISTYENTQYVSFNGVGHYSGRAAKNSVVQVAIEVWDHDSWANSDHIGNFRSSFSVPNDPSGRLYESQSVTADRGGVGTIRIEYSVQF